MQGFGLSNLAKHLANEINQGPCYVKIQNPSRQIMASAYLSVLLCLGCNFEINTVLTLLPLNQKSSTLTNFSNPLKELIRLLANSKVVRAILSSRFSIFSIPLSAKEPFIYYVSTFLLSTTTFSRIL